MNSMVWCATSAAAWVSRGATGAQQQAAPTGTTAAAKGQQAGGTQHATDNRSQLLLLLRGHAMPLPAGWQLHPVCNSKYHFIIPAESTLGDLSQIASAVEAQDAGRLPPGFTWAAQEAAADEEAGPYNAATSIFESQDHLLHGVLHLNGFGHLLRMNGSQGGSQRLIGALRAVGCVFADSSHQSIRSAGQRRAVQTCQC